MNDCPNLLPQFSFSGDGIIQLLKAEINLDVMIHTEKKLIDIIKRGQSGVYDKTAGLIRSFTGEIKKCIESKNPLNAELLIYQLDYFLEIVNPSLEKEIDWFNEAKDGLKLWSNDIVATNRLLGIKNDNTWDTSVFEKAIMMKFMLSKKPKPEARIETDFKTMVELVELGARQF